MSFGNHEVMSNPRADRVRDVARLSTAKERSKRGEFLAEGPQAIREALRRHHALEAAGEPGIVQAVYATSVGLDRLDELNDLRNRPLVREVTPEVLIAMADTVTPQGMVAVCRTETISIEELVARKPKLIAVLCRVQDPGNAGTILRAADAAGADALIITSESVDIFNPKAVRSTVGSLFHVPVATGVSVTDLAAVFGPAGIQILAADGYGSLDLDELQEESVRRRWLTSSESAPDAGGGAEEGGVVVLDNPTAWLFGNEARGLSEEELALSDARVAVPLYGIAESLNVGTAATVCLYASARAQRRANK
ncbi:TrmH family RNA methyltransferase [Neomicrococcus lactis]|uniref:TrmH family RNA methyltransferase n=1 Tax=Neomicrococcus lactis TaxID=732241 RepID=A0A7W8YAT7_9MICC|nr:RNA methyltransferase [Neomicrococcus lactis]MBB5598002.1 TrmH family RNA methyltransferase [Neomicrococcus lactis]